MSDSWHTTDPVGETVGGRYELLQVIARGGHGMVWRARDHRSGEVVALKMLTDVAAQDPELVERLRREQLMLRELAGTDAVQVRDLCSSASGKMCLVMELLDGIDLEQCFVSLEERNERMPVGELVRVLCPIVDTLEHAHARGIVHRDLKPANIFLVAFRAGGGVRLLDFGLARMRRSSPLTAAGMIMGSPSYIAPEVWKGRPDQLDRRVDVYSLGVIVFRGLAGRLPFGGVTLQEKFLQATTAPRPSLVALRPELPVDTDDWVAQVLAIDPGSRFNAVRAAWNALLEVLHVSPPANQHKAVSSSRIVPVEAGSEPFSVLPGGIPERSLVSEWLAQSDLRIEPSESPPTGAEGDLQVEPSESPPTGAGGEPSESPPTGAEGEPSESPPTRAEGDEFSAPAKKHKKSKKAKARSRKARASKKAKTATSSRAKRSKKAKPQTSSRARASQAPEPASPKQSTPTPKTRGKRGAKSREKRGRGTP